MISVHQFPYQFLAAYMNASDEVPSKIKTALHDAAEIACGNLPKLPGPVIIGLDTSGSMGCAITGNSAGHSGRGGGTSKMRCVDVAALFAAAILRRKTQTKLGIADPKLVCIDLQPYGTSQVPERSDILNIGGFSDAVFNVVSSFLEGDASRFVREVESVEL